MSDGVGLISDRTEPEKMAIVISPAAEVTILDVGWPVYEAFLQESGDHGHSRMAYNGDVLEIVAPSRQHEVYTRLLEVLVNEIGREWKIDLLGTGSVTLKAKPRAAEADASFYVGTNAALMRNADEDELNLTKDPAPDVVVEIDISRERIDKMELYAAFGVREFWRYDGLRLRAYDLRADGLPEIRRSMCLAGIPLAELDRFLEMRRNVSRPALTDSWQQWLHDNAPA